VDRRVDPMVRNQLQGIQGWRGMNNPWMPEDDGDMDFAYINLLENVERYTGYKASTTSLFLAPKFPLSPPPPFSCPVLQAQTRCCLRSSLPPPSPLHSASWA